MKLDNSGFEVGTIPHTCAEFVRGCYREALGLKAEIYVCQASDGALATLERRGPVLVGDVQREDTRAIAGAFTPLPGGAGPLTIVMLMSNTIQATRLRRGSRNQAQ
jgi:hypothetical protein